MATNFLHFIGNFKDPSTTEGISKLVHADYGKRSRMSDEADDKLRASMHGPLQAVPSRKYAEQWAETWLEGKIIGDPEPTRFSKLTVAELKALGIVGIYRNTFADKRAKAKKDAENMLGAMKIPYPSIVRIVDGKAVSLDEAYNKQEAAEADRLKRNKEALLTRG